MPTTRPKICSAGTAPGIRSSASASLPIGIDAKRNAKFTSLVTPPVPTSTMPLDQLRVLVSKLHGDTAAEGMADDGHPLDVQHREQVPHPVGVGRHRVIGAGLVGLAVAEQIRRDHREPLRQLGLHRLPR